jgi:hypothetical protein
MGIADTGSAAPSGSRIHTQVPLTPSPCSGDVSSAAQDLGPSSESGPSFNLFGV